MSRRTRWLRMSAVSLMALTVLAQSAQAAPGAPGKPKPTPDCGRQVFFKASGAPWRCSFADEFDGTSLDASKWTVQQTPGSQECFSAKNVAVAGGVLSLTTQKVETPVTCGSMTSSYTSGQVSGYGKYSQENGRFEVRARFPATQVAGLQSALWMWPVDANRYGPWPSSGEIDIAELYTTYPDRVIPYLHYDSQASDTSVTNNHCMIGDVSAFHTYVLEWTTTRITVTYDGQTCLDHTIDAVSPLGASGPFDQPFFMVLTQMLGVGDNAPTSSTLLPATTQVDYVRMWS